VDRDGGHLQLGSQGPLVERFNIRQLVHIAEIAGVELALRQRIEHERVVGVGAVGYAYRLRHRLPVEA
jgi:hypothetical protein